MSNTKKGKTFSKTHRFMRYVSKYECISTNSY